MRIRQKIRDVPETEEEKIRSSMAEVINEVEANQRVNHQVGTIARAVIQLHDLTSARFDRVDERFDRVDERFDRVDERFDRVDERFDRVESELGEVKTDVAGLKAEMAEVKSNLGRVETAVGVVGDDVRVLMARLERMAGWVVKDELKN